MAFQLINPTVEALRFLDDWNSSVQYVEAHTSGSTGVPKTIRLLKSDMLVSARATNERFDIDCSSTLLCPLSAGYIAGKMMIVRAVAADCRLIIESPSNTPLKDFYGTVDLMAVVPSQCEALIVNDYANQSIRNLIVGGAPLAQNMEAVLAAKAWHTFATYGMTETCSHVALREVGSDIYTAMPGITFSADIRGCLSIEAPKFSFRNLVTNDAVEILSPHSFRWLGRYDGVINSGGVKFFPEQLEKMLVNEIDIPFYIKGIPHPKWGEAVALVAEKQDAVDESAKRAEILAVCRKRLPRYAIPAEIIFVSALPRTTNGKIKRL